MQSQAVVCIDNKSNQAALTMARMMCQCWFQGHLVQGEGLLTFKAKDILYCRRGQGHGLED